MFHARYHRCKDSSNIVFAENAQNTHNLTVVYYIGVTTCNLMRLLYQNYGILFNRTTG